MGDDMIQLTYFDIEGVAEKVRLALVLTGIKFEDIRIAFADWGELKAKTKYGQVPTMKLPDGMEIAQSPAMLRWVGLSYESALGGSLYPQDIPSMLQIEETIGLIDDYSRSLQPCVYISMRPEMYGYPEDMDSVKKGELIIRLREKWIMEELPKFMKFFGDQIDKSGAFLNGEKPTIADCALVPQLRQLASGKLDHFPETVLDGYPVMKAYLERFLAIPQVAAWYSTTHA